MRAFSSLRLGEVSDVCQLVNECRELWADAAAWQSHLLAGACRLTGTSVGTFCESRLSPDRKSTVIYDEIDIGWRDEAARSHRTRMLAENPDRIAFFPRIYKLAGQAIDENRPAVVLRPEMRSDDEWYESRMFNEYRRPAFVDGFVMAFALNRRTGNLVFLQVCQDVSDPVPTEHARSIVSLLISQIAPMVGIELVGKGQRGLVGLSPRLRQTLVSLLAGHAEKQIAIQLGVSGPTAHEYVGSIYRHFNVSSRSELMAYFVQRRALPSRLPLQQPEAQSSSFTLNSTRSYKSANAIEQPTSLSGMIDSTPS